MQCRGGAKHAGGWQAEDPAVTARLRLGLIAAGGIALAVLMHWYFSPSSQCLRTAAAMGYDLDQAAKGCNAEGR